MMIEKAINNQDQDHQKEKVHLTMMLKNAMKNQDQDH